MRSEGTLLVATESPRTAPHRLSRGGQVLGGHRAEPEPATSRTLVVRHLTPEQAAFALRTGRAIEQAFGREQSRDDPGTVRWFTISERDSMFVVRRHLVEDVGGAGFGDLRSFPPIDPDEPSGEGVEVDRSSQADEAITVSATHGASPHRWVNFGVVADEYRDSL